MPTESHEGFLAQELRSPDLAADYLSATLDEGCYRDFLVALRLVDEANSPRHGLRVEMRDGVAVAVPLQSVPVLTAEEVEAVRHQLRKERAVRALR